MAELEYSTNQQRRVPVKRNSMFYDREEFLFDLESGREYVEGDMGQTVVLYQVDLNKTNQDAIYGETRTNSISFLTPVEIPVIYEISEAELQAYDKTKSLGTYQKMGILKVYVYDATLRDYGVDIKIGDYIGVQVDEKHMYYWCVNNDGRNNFDNGHLRFGTVPVYRTVTANYVDPSEFNA